MNSATTNAQTADFIRTLSLPVTGSTTTFLDVVKERSPDSTDSTDPEYIYFTFGWIDD